MKDLELSQAVEAWFKKTQNKRNRWNQTLTGKTIKNNLKQLKHWKNRPRGKSF